MVAVPVDDPLARYRRGDADAFRELVAAFRDRLVQFFLRASLDAQLAEDLTQEVFVKLLRVAPRYRPTGRLSVYVFRIARNLWIDHYRSQALRPRLVSSELPRAGLHGVSATEPQPFAAAVARDDAQAMQRALAALSPAHRAALEMAVFQELPYADVAAVLEIPVGTVKSRVHHAIAQLRAILAPECVRRTGA